MVTARPPESMRLSAFGSRGISLTPKRFPASSARSLRARRRGALTTLVVMVASWFALGNAALVTTRELTLTTDSRVCRGRAGLAESLR